MRSIGTTTGIAAALVMGLVLFCPAGQATESEGPVTVVGLVVDTDWDEDGAVIAIELETEEETYQVDLVGQGQALLDHVGEMVEVVGHVAEDEDGVLYIAVQSFTVLGDEE